MTYSNIKRITHEFNILFDAPHVHDLSLDNSTWNVASDTSFAANAVNTVAFVTVPFSVTAFSVRAWILMVDIFIIQYSPRPLNVYWRSSNVLTWGSPNVQAKHTKKKYFSLIFMRFIWACTYLPGLSCSFMGYVIVYYNNSAILFIPYW